MRAFIRHPSSIPIEIQAGDRITHALQKVENVSIGGVCCHSDAFLENGLLVNVKIEAVQPPFEAAGRVVWCEPEITGFRVGLQFLEVRDLLRVRLVEQVCHIENYRTRVLEEEGRTLDSTQAAMEWFNQYGSDFPDTLPPGRY